MKRSPLRRKTELKRKTGRLKRKSRIRPVSKKTAKRNREVAPFRRALKEEIGQCELCMKQGVQLDAHELTDAWSRPYVLDNRSCILVLCRLCHEEMELSPWQWGVARQAALLRLRREQDFNLLELNRWLTRKLDEDEVEFALRWLQERKVA